MQCTHVKRKARWLWGNAEMIRVRDFGRSSVCGVVRFAGAGRLLSSFSGSFGLACGLVGVGFRWCRVVRWVRGLAGVVSGPRGCGSG